MENFALKMQLQQVLICQVWFRQKDNSQNNDHNATKTDNMKNGIKTNLAEKRFSNQI